MGLVYGKRQRAVKLVCVGTTMKQNVHNTKATSSTDMLAGPTVFTQGGYAN